MSPKLVFQGLSTWVESTLKWPLESMAGLNMLRSTGPPWARAARGASKSPATSASVAQRERRARLWGAQG